MQAHHVVSVVLFLTMTSSFLYVWKWKGFRTAVMTASMISSLGLIIMPDFELIRLFVRLGGDPNLVVIRFNHLKIFILACMVISAALFKDKKEELGFKT